MTKLSQLLVRCIPLSALMIFSAVTLAEANAGGEDASQSLQKLLQPMESLSGEFTQQLIDAEGETLQGSEGDFWLQKPGKLNWHTQAPFEQQLITDSDNLWLYDPDLEQVTVKNIDTTLEQSPVSILSGNIDDFNTHYAIEQIESTDKVDEFVLLPKASEALFEKLTLKFNQGVIQSMELLDSLGQITSITLVNTELNPTIATEQFMFTAPPGTDVLVDD